MPRLIANQPFPYDARDLRAGEEFDASEKDAELLVKVGRARRTATEEAPYDSGVAQVTMYEVADAATDDGPAKRKPGRPKGSKNSYERRDMRAKE